MDNPNKIKVIILDDDKNICNMLCELLKPINWIEVSIVNTPKEFWRIYKYGEVGGILLDLNLEGSLSNGLDIAEKLRSIDPNIFIFVITGYSEVISNEKLLNSGIDDILIKPFELQILRSRLFLMFSRLRRWENVRNLINVNSKYYEERLAHLKMLMDTIKGKMTENGLNHYLNKENDSNGREKEHHC